MIRLILEIDGREIKESLERMVQFIMDSVLEIVIK